MGFSEWIILCTGGQSCYNYFISPTYFVDRAHHKIFSAKVGKGGISSG